MFLASHSDALTAACGSTHSRGSSLRVRCEPFGSEQLAAFAGRSGDDSGTLLTTMFALRPQTAVNANQQLTSIDFIRHAVQEAVQQVFVADHAKQQWP